MMRPSIYVAVIQAGVMAWGRPQITSTRNGCWTVMRSKQAEKSNGVSDGANEGNAERQISDAFDEPDRWGAKGWQANAGADRHQDKQ